jgi:hypothetical protein
MPRTKSHVDRVYDLLQQRVEGGGEQEFINWARRLDVAVQLGLVKPDCRLKFRQQSPAPFSWEDGLTWEDEVAYVLLWMDVYERTSDGPLFTLMSCIGQLLDEVQQEPPAENLEQCIDS